LTTGLKGIPGINVEKDPPPTNLVFIRVAEDRPINAYKLSSKLKEMGVLISPVADRRIRMVTHYWIKEEEIERAVAKFRLVEEIL
jgi:threonine aldolase